MFQGLNIAYKCIVGIVPNCTRVFLFNIETVLNNIDGGITTLLLLNKQLFCKIRFFAISTSHSA